MTAGSSTSVLELGVRDPVFAELQPQIAAGDTEELGRLQPFSLGDVD